MAVVRRALAINGTPLDMGVLAKESLSMLTAVSDNYTAAFWSNLAINSEAAAMGSEAARAASRPRT
jgi:hypothetical protein